MVSCVVYGPRKGDAEQKTAQCFYQNYTQGVYFAHKKPFHFLCCHCRIFASLEESLHFLQYVGGNKQLHLGEWMQWFSAVLKNSLLQAAPVCSSNLSCPVGKKVCLHCPGSSSLLCSPLECAQWWGVKRQTWFKWGKWKPFILNKNIFKGNFIPEEPLPEIRLIEEYWPCSCESKLLGACVWPVIAHPWLRTGICYHLVWFDREKEMWPWLPWVTDLIRLFRRWVKNGHGLG